MQRKESFEKLCKIINFFQTKAHSMRPTKIVAYYIFRKFKLLSCVKTQEFILKYSCAVFCYRMNDVIFLRTL